MRRLTFAFLCATYLCLSLIVALTLWRSGGGWSAGVAAFLGAGGLCMAIHTVVRQSLQTGSLRAEIAVMREAHRLLLDSVARVDGRLSEIDQTVSEDVAQRSQALADEVHMLEDLVRAMRRQLDEQGEAAALFAASPEASHPAGALLEAVRSALADGRVDLYLQPVVTLPQRRTVYYESFSRLRDETGRVLMPAEFLGVAEPNGLVAAIDNLLLFRCVQIVRRLARQDRKIGIFCNISMSSLADETFFPQFLEMLAANRDLSGALIFEIGQAAFNARGALEARNMGKLAELGFRFSVDKVVDLDIDFQDLARSEVKFLKVSADALLEELIEIDGRMVLRTLPDLAAEDFAMLTRRYGVEVVADKIESERQVVDVLELDVGLGQGNLLGEPRAIREQVLAEAGRPESAAEAPPPPVAPEKAAPRRRIRRGG